MSNLLANFLYRIYIHQQHFMW